MNDTGGGVTAIHDVPGDITRIGFHWMLFFPFCHSKGASICSSHGESRRSRGFFLSRIIELSIFFTRNVAEITDFFVPIFFLVPNFRIFSSHGESRRSRIFFVPNFRIIELFLHTENRGDYGFSLSRDLSFDPLTNRR